MADPAFIVYDNRSGSTQLSSLLDSYESVAVSKETDFVFRVLEYKWQGAFNIDHFFAYLNKTRFNELKISFDELKNKLGEAQKIDHKVLLDTIGDLYFEKEGQASCQLKIIKGPKIQYYIKELNQLYPDAKYIHIIRDGRAVLNSKKNTISVYKVGDEYASKKAMDINTVHTAMKWVEKAKLIEGYPNVVTVKYESLVTDTANELERIIKFCRPNLEVKKRGDAEGFKDQKIDDVYKVVHDKVGEEQKKSRIVAWKDELSRKDILVYEWIAKDVLKRYQYSLSVVSQNISFLDKVTIYFTFVGQYIGQLFSRILFYMNVFALKLFKKQNK